MLRYGACRGESIRDLFLQNQDLSFTKGESWLNCIRRKNIYFYVLIVVVSATAGYLSPGKNFSFDICYSLQGDGTYTAMQMNSIRENFDGLRKWSE